MTDRIPVTVVMVPYNNEDKALVRLRRDLLPALAYLDAELIVIDNSAERSFRLVDGVNAAGGRYCWQQGRNLMYGPAMNLAVELATKPYVLYLCTEHGYARDPTWPLDLLKPLVDDYAGKIAMTGCIRSSGPPTNLGFPADLPEIHVQGGVFAARRDVLRAFPYPTEVYPHLGSDVYECFQLMAAGFQLVDVPTIRSEWRKAVWRKLPGARSWKYVHGEKVFSWSWARTETKALRAWSLISRSSRA
jgi:GT2 family glycosyltransferase